MAERAAPITRSAAIAAELRARRIDPALFEESDLERVVAWVRYFEYVRRLGRRIGAPVLAKWIKSGDWPPPAPDPPLTPAVLNYLRAFEEWLHNQRDADAYRRRRNALGLMLTEAGVRPKYRPQVPSGLEEVADEVDQMYDEIYGRPGVHERVALACGVRPLELPA
jgi:hypothetical protein